MDPVMILASRATRPGLRKDDIDAFYHRHGFDAATPMRAARSLIASVRSLISGREEFVVRHPAE